jgi:hypothetical protein
VPAAGFVPPLSAPLAAFLPPLLEVLVVFAISPRSPAPTGVLRTGTSAGHLFSLRVLSIIEHLFLTVTDVSSVERRARFGPPVPPRYATGVPRADRATF